MRALHRPGEAWLLLSLACLAPVEPFSEAAGEAGEAGCTDESSLLMMRRSSAGEMRKPDAADREFVKSLYSNPEDAVQTAAGTNLKTNYTYGFSTDCYSQNYTCPTDQWCQVETRPNWYPWDVSYMNRGRCLPYAALGAACEAAFPGETAFPRKADGTFFSRPVHCGPPGEAICTGEAFSKVIPPTCVEQRNPARGCMSSMPYCAGRPAGNGSTVEEQLSNGECPPLDKDFCVCPKGSSEMPGDDETSCSATSIVTKEKLEQCGSIFNSFNGPNFALQFEGLPRSLGSGLPSDSNIEAGQFRPFQKLALEHGTNAALANHFLKELWPYPVCSEGGPAENCTQFPLPVTVRDNDGGLSRKYVDGSDASWIPSKGAGVTDYHCSWMILHTLTFNGPALLTEAQQEAMQSMVMYLSGQFDCKVCRNNFVHIIEMFGVPSGPLRQTYAEWMWNAHNVANEHTYATHSPQNGMILDSNGALEASDRRWDMWASPDYFHPWFMSFDDARRTWVL